MKKLRHRYWILIVVCIFILSCAENPENFNRESINYSNFRSGSGDLICKNIEIDWWSVGCTQNGDDCTWTFLYTEYKSECYYSSSTAAPSGGSGGGTNDSRVSGGSSPIVSSQSNSKLDKITISNTMPLSSKTELREALNDFIANCLQSSVYEQIVIGGIKFNFKINASNPGPASYNPNNRALTFKSASTVTEEFLREELFHGYQDGFYLGGIAQYSNAGKSNIEFEAKLFKDLIGYVSGYPGQVFGVPYGNPLHDEYVSWISTITNGFTKFPSILPIDKYFYFLDAFKQSYTEYNTTTINSLYPDALMNAIKSSKCPK